MPRAVVLDCDGLLVDTEHCWAEAEAELFARRGLPFGREEQAALIGVSVPAACAALAERFADGSDPAAVERELLGRVRVILARDARAMAGAPELVAILVARVPVAVASNSPRALLDAALAHGGLSALAPHSVAADEVAQAKPAPDLYLTACRRLGVAPGHALALEDSATGIRAARAAGLRTLGVPTLPGQDIGAEVTVASLRASELMRWARGWPLRASD